MYKIIVLILSSSSDFYDELKKLQILYLKEFDPLIKFFFIEFREEQKESVIEYNNTLYFKGKESILPGMIIKTSLAINYLKDKYDYDFLFRTNLSTVINIPNLFKFINTLPKENVCSGFIVFGFITGTGIIMPKKVAELVSNNFEKFDYMDLNEDVIISYIFSFFNITYIPPENYRWGLIVDSDDEEKHLWEIYKTDNKFKNFNYSNNILYYRIKNINREIDLLYFKDLLKKLYKLDYVSSSDSEV